MEEFKGAKYVATVLDSKFKVLGVRFGINAILETLPWIGDTVAAAFSFYVIFSALRLKAPISVISSMVGNIAVAYFIGLIPFFGDIFYIFYKPNMRNITILEDYLHSSMLANSKMIV